MTISKKCDKRRCDFTLAKSRGLKRKQFSLCYKHINCIHITMHGRGVHHSLYHALSDDDATAELHIHDGMVWRHTINKQS